MGERQFKEDKNEQWAIFDNERCIMQSSSSLSVSHSCEGQSSIQMWRRGIAKNVVGQFNAWGGREREGLGIQNEPLEQHCESKPLQDKRV